MALQAIGESIVHRFFVRFTMAGLTCGYRFMLGFVAVRTLQIVMPGAVLRQILRSLRMTAGAVRNRRGFRIADNLRLMWLMTGEAVIIGLPFNMRIVAVEAAQILTVLLVTSGTAQLGMQTGILLQLGTFVLMAGNTYRVNLTCASKIDSKGMVRIMTADTIIHLIM